MERQKYEMNYTNFSDRHAFCWECGGEFCTASSPKNTDTDWDNYFGTKTYAGGIKYIGKLKDGKKRKGIFPYANGRVEEGT